MNIAEMRVAIEQESASLDEALALTSYATESPEVREGWKAWEWCRRQLVAKGTPEEHAMAMRGLYMKKARHMGTYDAIHACVFGEPGVATLVIG